MFLVNDHYKKGNNHFPYKTYFHRFNIITVMYGKNVLH